jgi:hypothetical protein
MFAAVLESGCGTFETFRRTPKISVDWGRPEVTVHSQNDVIDPTET